MNWYYKNSEDNSLRFVLGLEKTDLIFPGNSIICIGVNPSTATPDKPDSTIRNVQKIIAANGYDNFYMMNLYPQRARDIKVMDQEIDMTKHEENMYWFRRVMGLYSIMNKKGIDVWCAWGNLIESRDYLREICLRDIKTIAAENSCHFYSVGPVSQGGNPHHPLYVKSNTIKEPYDLSHYFK